MAPVGNATPLHDVLRASAALSSSGRTPHVSRPRLVANAAKAPTSDVGCVRAVKARTARPNAVPNLRTKHILGPRSETGLARYATVMQQYLVKFRLCCSMHTVYTQSCVASLSQVRAVATSALRSMCASCINRRTFARGCTNKNTLSYRQRRT